MSNFPISNRLNNHFWPVLFSTAHPLLMSRLVILGQSWCSVHRIRPEFVSPILMLFLDPFAQTFSTTIFTRSSRNTNRQWIALTQNPHPCISWVRVEIHYSLIISLTSCSFYFSCNVWFSHCSYFTTLDSSFYFYFCSFLFFKKFLINRSFLFTRTCHFRPSLIFLLTFRPRFTSPMLRRFWQRLAHCLRGFFWLNRL